MRRLSPGWTAAVSGTGLVAFLGALATISPPFFGILLFVGSVVACALAVVGGVVGFLLRNRADTSGERALGWLAAVILAGAAVGGGLIAVLVGPEAGPLVGAGLAAIGAFWWLTPLATGLWLSRRWGVAPGWLLVAWPVSVLLGLAVFFLPAAVGRTNLTFVEGPVQTGALLALAAVVTVGPGVLAARLAAWREPAADRERVPAEE